jgi:hypothetical protein
MGRNEKLAARPENCRRMKYAGNLILGTVGTTFAAIAPEKAAAIFAGVATGSWMLWQIGCGMYDRATRRRRENN